MVMISRKVQSMMTKNDKAVGEKLVATVPIDPLRSAFAAAMGALIQALPPSYARDTAIEQLIAAHTRTEEVLARHRVLN
jgi:hypothetical protein